MDTFLRDVEDFLRRTGMTGGQFGRAVLNDTGFVRQVREGRSPTMRTVRKVRSWMEGNDQPRAKRRRMTSVAPQAEVGR